MMNAEERIVRATEMERMVRKKEEKKKITLKREEEMVPLEPKKEAVEAVRIIAERKKNVPIEEMKSSNRKITEIMKVSPGRYFIMMSLGLVAVIIGGVMLYYIEDLIYVLLIISGVGIFLIELVDFKEAKYIENKIGLENGNREKWKDVIPYVLRKIEAYSFLVTKSIVRQFRLINYNVKIFVRRGQ